jgi:multidrug efflux pump
MSAATTGGHEPQGAKTRSFTDIFIKHPVLASVVNLVIVLVGWRALSLPVQQYPKIESSSVLITTVYTGASAETVRGFLTTPIERVVSAIGGVDTSSRPAAPASASSPCASKLNHSTAALAEVTARLQQVRSELPSEAEPPIVEVQRADRPYASFYLSFTSSRAHVPRITDWLDAHVAAAARDARRRAARRPTRAAVRSRCACGSIPTGSRRSGSRAGRRHAALQRNNYLAAVGQTKGNLVQVNLLANTDLRTVEGVRGSDRRGPRRRARAPVGRRQGRARRRGSRSRAKYNGERSVYLGVWPLIGANEIDVARRLRAEMDRLRPTLPSDIDMRLAYDAHGVHARRAHRDHEDADRDDPDRRRGRVPVPGLGPHRARAAGRDARVADRRGDRDVAFGLQLNLLTILAIVLSVGLVVDDAIVVVENVERHVRSARRACRPR